MIRPFCAIQGIISQHYLKSIDLNNYISCYSNTVKFSWQFFYLSVLKPPIPGRTYDHQNFPKSTFAATLTASAMTGITAHADDNEVIERVKPVGQLIVLEGDAAAALQLTHPLKLHQQQPPMRAKPLMTLPVSPVMEQVLPVLRSLATRTHGLLVLERA